MSLIIDPNNPNGLPVNPVAPVAHTQKFEIELIGNKMYIRPKTSEIQLLNASVIEITLDPAAQTMTTSLSPNFPVQDIVLLMNVSGIINNSLIGILNQNEMQPEVEQVRE